MAKSKVQNKNSKQQHTATEVFENPDSLKDRLYGSEAFFQKNKKWLFIGGGVLVALVGAIFLYFYMKNQQESEAQIDIFPATYYLEADSLDKALKGDGNYEGFLAVAENYPLSKTGNLAHFYAGVALLKKGEFQQAIEQLKAFSSDDLLVQARAKSLIGDAYMELNQLDNAIEYYQDAAQYRPNKFFTPQYLMKLALAYELKNDKASAIETYDKIINEYYDSAERPNAMKFKAKLATQP